MRKINTDNTCRAIFSQRLAGWLMLKGFVLVELKPDERNDRRNVFFFKDSSELIAAINQYKTR